MGDNQGVKYAVDLVMCIDGTGSMGHLIEQVKDSARQFYSKLEAKMEQKSKKIDQLRAKVIVFRDYWADPEDLAMQQSDFYDLRTQAGAFANFVSNITADGGGDEPENGLEALALALKSNWEKSQSFARQRHVVVMYTDASAHSLEKGSKPSFYPSNIPNNLDELSDLWSEMSTASKRLVLFAPDATPWSIIGQGWDSTIYTASKAGEGLEEFDMDQILDVIANSI